MTEQSFADFLRRKARPASSDVDWAARRDLWLRQVDDLYRRIEDYLAEFAAQDLIQSSREPIERHEEYIGSYTSEVLKLRIGENKVSLTPIATLVIGGAGRVDMEGPRGSVRIVLVDKDLYCPQISIMEGDEEPNRPARPPEWVWKIVLYKPHMQYVDLDETSFQPALMAIADA